MARKAILEGGKRDELISAALKLFMEHGYEQTSIRMILDEVGGQVGMFYHYFKSKDEIFDAAIELYLKQYVVGFAAIATDDSQPALAMGLKTLTYFENSALESRGLFNSATMHWSMMLALNQSTVNALIPSVKLLIDRGIAEGSVHNTMDLDSFSLAAFLVHGLSGIVHSIPLENASAAELAAVKRKLVDCIMYTLQIDPRDIAALINTNNFQGVTQ